MELKISNINKLEQNIFIDEDGERWHKIRSKNYAVIGDDETLIGTATLFSSGKHGWFKYIDVDHGIEAAKHWNRATAKIFFEELLEICLGKVYWE